MSQVAWHEVGAAGDEPEGTLRRVEVGDTAVCLARTGEGWLAFDDTCTHEECSLAGGELDGEVVICPCHGSEFDLRTGDVVTPPALEPLPIYEAREDGGTLFVRLAAPRGQTTRLAGPVRRSQPRSRRFRAHPSTGSRSTTST